MLMAEAGWERLRALEENRAAAERELVRELRKSHNREALWIVAFWTMTLFCVITLIRTHGAGWLG